MRLILPGDVGVQVPRMCLLRSMMLLVTSDFKGAKRLAFRGALRSKLNCVATLFAVGAIRLLSLSHFSF